jgi:hypothetical protein
MIIVFISIVLSFIVGAIASTRKIGFWGAFLISLFFSPIIGILVALLSPIDNENKSTNTINSNSNFNSDYNSEYIDELLKIKKLKDDNIISEPEFEKIKYNLKIKYNISDDSKNNEKIVCDDDIMKKYGISYNGEKYIYNHNGYDYKYDELKDAVNYAKNNQ